MVDPEIHQGGCLCGAVRYEVTGPLDVVNYCHCTQCQKSTGHFYASSMPTTGELRLLASETLKWYRSSSFAERGFCSTCGSQLFWRRVGGAGFSFVVGSLDGDPKLAGGHHIFVEAKKSYYSINDGLPQHAGFPKGNSPD